MRAQGDGEIKSSVRAPVRASVSASVRVPVSASVCVPVRVPVCAPVCAHLCARLAQMCAQGDGEIKWKKVNARTGLWGNQVQKGQCAHRRAHRVMGKSSAKRLMRAQMCTQGDGEIKCKKVNARTGLWENQVQKGQCAHRRVHRVMGKSSAKRSMRAQ